MCQILLRIGWTSLSPAGTIGRAAAIRLEYVVDYAVSFEDI